MLGRGRASAVCAAGGAGLLPPRSSAGGATVGRGGVSCRSVASAVRVAVGAGGVPGGLGCGGRGRAVDFGTGGRTAGADGAEGRVGSAAVGAGAVVGITVGVDVADARIATRTGSAAAVFCRSSLALAWTNSDPGGVPGRTIRRSRTIARAALLAASVQSSAAHVPLLVFASATMNQSAFWSRTRIRRGSCELVPATKTRSNDAPGSTLAGETLALSVSRGCPTTSVGVGMTAATGVVGSVASNATRSDSARRWWRKRCLRANDTCAERGNCLKRAPVLGEY